MWFLFNTLEGRAAPQNSFVSNTSVDSSLIGSAKNLGSFQRDSKISRGH
jgi:hypothetical protein